MSEPSKSLALPPAVAPLVHAVKNGLAVPLMVMMMLAMMVVPLAPIALDEQAFLPDGIHPNAAAQPRLLDHAWPVLEPLFKTSTSD